MAFVEDHNQIDAYGKITSVTTIKHDQNSIRRSVHETFSNGWRLVFQLSEFGGFTPDRKRQRAN